MHRQELTWYSPSETLPELIPGTEFVHNSYAVLLRTDSDTIFTGYMVDDAYRGKFWRSSLYNEIDFNSIKEWAYLE